MEKNNTKHKQLALKAKQMLIFKFHFNVCTIINSSLIYSKCGLSMITEKENKKNI